MNDYADRTKEELIGLLKRQDVLISELQESQDWLDCLEGMAQEMAQEPEES